MLSFDSVGPETVIAQGFGISAISHRLGWDRLEYGKHTDEDREPLGSPRVAAFSRGLLLNLALF